MAGLCCGVPDHTLQDDADDKIVSPILNLDLVIVDYVYAQLAKTHNDMRSCFERPFPKQKDMDIRVFWDKITFLHNVPQELSLKAPNGQNTADVNNANKDVMEMKEVKATPKSLDMEGGFDPANRMKSFSKEVFTIKYDNTTNESCKTTLAAERRMTSAYEVEVSKSVQTGHRLQLGLKTPEPCGIEAAYEFNRMLESYKGERKSEVTETAMNIECPVDIEPKTSAEAIITTTYQSFKQTLHIVSEFSGTLNVVASEKRSKARGKRIYLNWANDAASTFENMCRDASGIGKILSQYLSVHGSVVRYTSVATFSSNFGVDRHVKIEKHPLSNAN